MVNSYSNGSIPIPSQLNYNFQIELYADQIAQFFVQVLKNGTTTALVFCTVHTESVDALFEAAGQHQMRLIAGKVMMDRHAPEDLRATHLTVLMRTLKH